MIPMHRIPDAPEERTHVLVPGLFGLGFLISLGVLPKPDTRLSRRERARGFRDTGFAPDPFAHPRR